jgi:HlyD family secretion protein
VVSLPIQALTVEPTKTPATTGGVQAASIATPAANASKTPVQGVYVVDKDAKGKLRAKFVPVTTGITGATNIEVLSGLSPGQEIVIGPFKTLRGLKDNALVKRDTEKPVVTTSGS